MSLSRYARFLIAGLVATIALGAAVSSATASTGASVTNGVSSASANGKLTLSGPVTIVCDVTLSLNLNASIAKTNLAQIGTVQLGDTIRNCNLGTINGVILNGITVNYLGFRGTLPDITQINTRALNAGFQLNNVPILGSCLWRGTVDTNFNRNVATLEIDTVDLNASSTLSSSCGTGSLRGTLTVLPTKPRINLI